MANPIGYVTLAQLKKTLTLSGQSYADDDLTAACVAASRAVDNACGRRFYADADASQVRYYTPESLRYLPIDDLVTFTGLAIDRAGTGTYSETWTQNTDFVLEPPNAPADFFPFEVVRVRALSGRWFPTYIERSVQLTGKFGWATVPDDIYMATEILAAKLVRRVREAPFGVVALGIDATAAMRIARTDPDVYTLTQRFAKTRPII